MKIKNWPRFAMLFADKFKRNKTLLQNFKIGNSKFAVFLLFDCNFDFQFADNLNNNFVRFVK